MKPNSCPYSQPAGCETHTYYEEKSTWLGKEPEKVISAAIEPNSVYEIAWMLEAKGCSLYNIDLDTVRQYLLEHSLFPMARLRGDVLDDSQYALDYEIPDLSKKHRLYKYPAWVTFLLSGSQCSTCYEGSLFFSLYYRKIY